VITIKTLTLLGLLAALAFGSLTTAQAGESCCKPDKKECCTKGSGDCCKKK